VVVRKLRAASVTAELADKERVHGHQVDEVFAGVLRRLAMRGILPLRNHNSFLPRSRWQPSQSVPCQSEGGPATAESDTVSFVGERLVYRVKWDPPWFFFSSENGGRRVEIELTDEPSTRARKR